MVIVVRLGSVGMNAKFEAHVFGSTDLSSSFVAPDSTSGSFWPHNLSITTIQLNDSNYAK